MALFQPCRARRFSTNQRRSLSKVWQGWQQGPSTTSTQPAAMQPPESQPHQLKAQPDAQLSNFPQDIDWEMYRRNVGICVVNREGRVFVAQRVDDKSGSWQMPQGGIDAGENSAEAALRELSEETSITNVEIISELPAWLKYDFPPEVRSSMKLRNIGQAQRWFLMRFTGEDHEINLETEHKEFNAWSWMPLESLPSRVIYFKREVYEEVVRHFSPVIKQMGHTSSN